MEANGGNQTRITSTSAFEREPAWSPDGTLIAYASGENVVIQAPSSGAPTTPIDVGPVGAEGAQPTWAPVPGSTSGGGGGGGASLPPPSVSTGLPQAPKRCVVPNLIGKTLKAAKKRARKANCGLSLKGASGKKKKVIKQRPKAGRVKAPGAKIAITLG
jgi:hypothetical protein